jgi:hypothetical protein
MTQSGVLFELTDGSPPRIFKEGREDRITERDTLQLAGGDHFPALRDVRCIGSGFEIYFSL